MNRILPILLCASCAFACDTDELRSSDLPCIPDEMTVSFEPETQKLIYTSPGIEGGECYEELVCCDTITGGCFCYSGTNGEASTCPNGSKNPNAPSNQ